LLLQHGSKVDAQNKRGCTALHEAVRRCRTDIIEALQAQHTNPTISDKDGNSLLSIAIETRYYTIVQMLLNSRDSNGLAFKFSEKDQNAAEGFLRPLRQHEAELQEKEKMNLHSYRTDFKKEQVRIANHPRSFQYNLL
jgi:ankyrin repeat protein